MDPRIKQACKSKLRFGHERTVKQFAEKQSLKTQLVIKTYQCPVCKGFHLTKDTTKRGNPRPLNPLERPNIWVDFSGYTIGNFTVLGHVEGDRRLWRCQCSCGEVEIHKAKFIKNLTQKHTCQSCLHRSKELQK